MSNTTRTKEFSKSQQNRMDSFLRRDGRCVIEDIKNDRYISYHGRFSVAVLDIGSNFLVKTEFRDIKTLVRKAQVHDKFVSEFEKLSKFQRFILGLFKVHVIG